MTEHPLIFNREMVLSLLAERKTQTRRVLKVQPLDIIAMPGKKRDIEWIGHMQKDPPKGLIFRCRHGVPGNRIWVKETWGIRDCGARVSLASEAWPGGWPRDRLLYNADATINFEKRSAMFMPRWASRLMLEITRVRVQRLQAISPKDAIAEGLLPVEWPTDRRAEAWAVHVDAAAHRDPRDCYRELWDSLNGKRAPWASNPWIWAIDFRRIEQ